MILRSQPGKPRRPLTALERFDEVRSSCSKVIEANATCSHTPPTKGPTKACLRVIRSLLGPDFFGGVMAGASIGLYIMKICEF